MDSGQLGFIYTTRSLVKEVLGIKRITKAARAAITQYLKDEVSAYSCWLNGWVFTSTIYDEDGNDLSSCGGFLGSEAAIKDAKSTIDWLTKEA